MQAQRMRRSFAVAAAGALLASGAAIGTAGTAAAAPAPSTTSISTVHHARCTWVGGHWVTFWVKGHHGDHHHGDHHGNGHWVKKWVRGHWSPPHCNR
ncbi:hypothetical protein [Streptomyces sp. NPDC053427]|uniref:hypothetical protein n=1 Tax=Streptomyces sp. NPDC053427 TaxID=3365701 RepID=UPI0037D25091